MVDHRDEHLDSVFRALAHPARRAILRRIARSEQTVTELAEPFDMSLEAVSKHVRVFWNERASCSGPAADGIIAAASGRSRSKTRQRY